MNDSIAAKPTDGPADSTAAGTDPALTATAKLTPREKKWIIYDVGNSAFVLLSTAVIPIYAKSLMPADGNIVSPGATRRPSHRWSSRCSCRCSARLPTCRA